MFSIAFLLKVIKVEAEIKLTKLPATYTNSATKIHSKPSKNNLTFVNDMTIVNIAPAIPSIHIKNPVNDINLNLSEFISKLSHNKKITTKGYFAFLIASLIKLKTDLK